MEAFRQPDMGYDERCWAAVSTTAYQRSQADSIGLDPRDHRSGGGHEYPSTHLHNPSTPRLINQDCIRSEKPPFVVGLGQETKHTNVTVRS